MENPNLKKMSEWTCGAQTWQVAYASPTPHPDFPGDEDGMPGMESGLQPTVKSLCASLRCLLSLWAPADLQLSCRWTRSPRLLPKPRMIC